MEQPRPKYDAENLAADKLRLLDSGKPLLTRMEALRRATETFWPNEHIRRAVSGAQEGSLLAQNLVKHYQNQSLAEVKRILAVKSAYTVR